jgi:hypothetical protein
MNQPKANKISLREFLGRDESAEVQALIGTFNGGSFMCCHTQIFMETGIWLDELVPVFQRLDAHLATSTERRVRVLSPESVTG